jgi:hypothetical protein
VHTGLGGSDAGRRLQVLATSVDRRHALVPVSLLCLRRGKWFWRPLDIRDRHRGVTRTVEDPISLIENVFNFQEASLQQRRPGGPQFFEEQSI